ncbi:phage tail protein [Carnobacterium divergens]|uniref:Phage tail protein n=1 Tax=Carnobacterium divergens TaxID=2748 RepID=A0AAW8R7I4_CARDV|nr:phage tail protein [Carnobacterium divergens]MDT1957573.1 phage tail protein [Carnobacterium divergens]MDT1973776.1 phage tail protein [Carnobacterium divergens]MDT2011119.1 phage tail protein [Carnobacterium divergens]
METVFDEYRITNGTIKWKGTTTSESTKLGCTGKLSLETELKTVVKTCEGDEVLSIDIPTKQTGTLSLHMPVETARKAFGLNTKGLKKGVFAYGTQSRQGGGCLTFDVYDIFEEMKKLMALPNITFSGGFKWELENGNEEIAEVEIEFQSLKDEGNNFYYEALESEVEDEDVKTKWHENFSYALVKEAVPAAKNRTAQTDKGAA